MPPPVAARRVSGFQWYLPCIFPQSVAIPLSGQEPKRTVAEEYLLRKVLWFAARRSGFQSRRTHVGHKGCRDWNPGVLPGKSHRGILKRTREWETATPLETWGDVFHERPEYPHGNPCCHRQHAGLPRSFRKFPHRWDDLWKAGEIPV